MNYILLLTYMYRICPNRSTVRECKGLGARLLISTINPVVRYLLPTIRIKRYTGTACTFVY